ncbi:MAG: hypothetical protein LBS31_11795 [Candidatus Adiutrix sp.]|nr:hypothetical protein [Candidatus Adiutrix sp.]
MGLVFIARYHQMAATLEGMRHQFAPAVKALEETARFGAQEILLKAKYSAGIRNVFFRPSPAFGDFQKTMAL